MTHQPIDIYAEVRTERERAHAKHGDKSMESAPWTAERRLRILLEEVGEVAKEFNDADIDDRAPDAAAVRKELVQVAAMAAAWADAIPQEPGTSRGSGARESGEERLRAYAEAMIADDDGSVWSDWRQYADMVRGAMAVADAEQEALRAELAKYQRGGKALGQTIEKQCQMILDITGLHDWIGEDGDGDWGAVWDHAYALRPRLEAAEAERVRLAEVVERVRGVAEALVTAAQIEAHGGEEHTASLLLAVRTDLLMHLDADAPDASEEGHRG